MQSPVVKWFFFFFLFWWSSSYSVAQAGLKLEDLRSLQPPNKLARLAIPPYPAQTPPIKTKSFQKKTWRSLWRHRKYSCTQASIEGWTQHSCIGKKTVGILCFSLFHWLRQLLLFFKPMSWGNAQCEGAFTKCTQFEIGYYKWHRFQGNCALQIIKYVFSPPSAILHGFGVTS